MAAQSELGQIQEFLLVFKRRIWQVIVPALFILAIGVVFAVIVPKKFVVFTQVELLQPSGHVTTPEASATMREISNADFHLRNFNRVKETIVSQNWVEYAQLNDEDRYDYIMSVRNNIAVKVHTKKSKDEQGSVFVDITYSDVDARRAEKFLSALTKRWIDDVVQRDRNQLIAERDEYQNQVDEAEDHYHDVLKKFTDLIQEMGISITQPTDLTSQREEDPLFVELGIARQERDRVEAELEERRAKIQKLRDDHERMERRIPVEEVEEGVDYSNQILALEGKISDMRRLQQGKTSEHSIYKKAEVEIESLQDQIKIAESLQREASKRTVYKDNPERKQLGKRIEEMEIEVQGLEAKLGKWSAEVEDKASKHQAQVANWNDLLRLHKAWEHAQEELDEANTLLRRANSRYKTYSAAQGEPYRIAEEPRAPAEATEPDPVVIVVASLLGGIAFGLAVAFLAEFSKSCFRSVGDLSRVMGVPILGVVNTIETKAEIRRRRFKRLVVGGSTLMILGSIGWFTYAWVYTPQKLPTSVVQAVDDFRLSLR
ncbi:MAG: hypothetical protein AAF682_27290 [Planctomycetota bacterium]